MEDKKYKYGFKMVGDKKIPLTKSGLLNLVFLKKQTRVLVKDFAEKREGMKTEILNNEVIDILNSLNLK
jgi:hypothetical protein